MQPPESSWGPPGQPTGPGGAPPAPPPPAAPPTPTNYVGLLIAVGVGTLVSVGLGVYAKTHDPTGTGILPAGFGGAYDAKSAIATVVVLLALGQVIGALWMYGKLPFAAPSWLGAGHRWSGRLAVLVSVPVAVHCLYSAGYQDFTSRQMWHSLLGCFVYGAFAAKMLVLSRNDAPSWALPVFGGLVFSGFTGLWLTGALWWYQQ